MTELVRAGPVGAEVVPAHGVADFEVSPATEALAELATSAATRRAYIGNWGRYAQWCETAGRVPMPATGQTLAEYAAHLAEHGARGGPAAPRTIEQALSTIVAAHAGTGHGRPDTRLATQVVKGYRRRRAAEGKRDRQAPPLTLGHLRAMVERCPPSAAGVRDHSLLTLGFAGMFRRSEIVAFDESDVTEDEDRGLLVLVRMSKTDQDAVGIEVPIKYGNHEETCPVRCWRAWQAVRVSRGIAGGPLYPRVDRNDRIAGQPGAGLAGMASATGRLNTGSVGFLIRRAGQAAGLPGAADFSAHSLRSGGATQAREGGAEIEVIARAGRWRDGSPVVFRYMRTVDRWAQNATAFMGL